MLPTISIANDVIELHVVLNSDVMISSFITKIVLFVVPTNKAPLYSRISVGRYGFVDMYFINVKSSRLRNSM